MRGFSRLRTGKIGLNGWLSFSGPPPTAQTVVEAFSGGSSLGVFPVNYSNEKFSSS
jgi:hypothetical protein